MLYGLWEAVHRLIGGDPNIYKLAPRDEGPKGLFYYLRFKLHTPTLAYIITYITTVASITIVVDILMPTSLALSPTVSGIIHILIIIAHI